MKKRGITGMLLLGLLLISTIACSGGEETTTQPTVKSDINVTVTGDGNIEASSHERLTFGGGGKVDEISVKEGDRVSKGVVLARLDTGALELAEAQAQVALTLAQLALTGQELAKSQAEINVKNAEIALERAKDSWLDTESAGIKVKRLERSLEWYLEEDQEDHERIALIRLDLREAWNRFLMIASDSTDARQVKAKELELELAKQSAEHAQQNVNLAQQNVNLAQKSLDQTQKYLEEATILAPFDGMVSRIGVKEGEFLSPVAYTGTTIVEIIDLRHMELTARVDELDVVKVKTGQRVMISVNAMPGAKLEGRVTFISPVAREPGVVLFEDEDEEKSYEVKIDFDIPENSPIRAGMSATAEIFVE
jgi:multidrug efflux pump subunit AcrA (membrane-fusion protein)